MKKLLADIRQCTLCSEHLPLGPRPVLRASKTCKILVIGQAPGTKVHASGTPWDDPSGRTLRKWMGLSDEQFYDETVVGIVPMGFCYPGKGKSGDLPPRPECAEAWHAKLMAQMPEVEFTLLIGQYAQKYYLGNKMKSNLTETVEAFEEYLPKFLPLPHPSPRNRFWLTKNPWFEERVLLVLRAKIEDILM